MASSLGLPAAFLAGAAVIAATAASHRLRSCATAARNGSREPAVADS